MSSSGLRVLLIDDDRGLAELLAEYLKGHDVTLESALDGPSGLERLESGGVDLVLLDVMLPGLDGFEVCRRARSRSRVPIIMLTARGDAEGRIEGLDLGADDYVAKPFDPRELLARMRAVLRRTAPEPSSERVAVSGLVVDGATLTASHHGAPLDLTAFELRILLALARRAGKAVTREELSRAVHAEGAGAAEDYDPSVDRSIDVHISRLRQKLDDTAREPRLIKTIRGVGYLLTRDRSP